MKKCLAILVVVFFAGVVGFAVAQEAKPITKTGIVGWDAVTTNVDGTPCDDLDHYIVAVSAVDQDLNAGGSPLATIDADCTAEACQSRVDDLIAVVQEPAVKFWVAAVDVAGNQSEWSEPLEVPVNRDVPEKPTGLRVVVSVTVNVTVTE